MEHLIQSFWLGKTISTLERLSISSFLKNGHTFNIYVYDEIENLPPGVNQIDANNIIPRSEIFMDSAGGVASFSDWFRYKMLYEKGGWWVDLDVVCLRSFKIEPEFCFATENFSSDHQTGVTNCVIKSPPKAEFLRVILDKIESDTDFSQVKWGDFGPRLINSVVKDLNLSEFVLPFNAFCPIDWKDVGKIVHEQLDIPTNALAIHMWNNLWRINRVNKEISYSAGSLYEKLKSKYL